MTMPGVPCIYYGDELGMEGYGDPFSRRCFPWDNMDEVAPESVIRNWIKSLIALRKSSAAFSVGEMTEVYKIGYTYGYLREHNGEKYIVVVNFDSMHRDIRIDIARFGIAKLTSVLSTANNGEYSAQDGIFYIKNAPYSVTVYKAE